jgi:WD40 repeat protein
MASESRDADTPSTVRLWNAESGQELSVLSELKVHGACVAVSPDGTQVVIGGKPVRLWDISTKMLITALEGDYAEVRAVAFSPSGQWLATGYSDGALRLWDARTSKLLRELGRHGGAIEHVAFSPDSRCLATAGARAIVLWSCESGDLIHVIREWDEIRALDFSSDGARLLFGKDDGFVGMYDVSNSKSLRHFKAHQHPIVGVAFADRDRVVVTAASSEPVHVWNGSDGRFLRSLSCGESYPTSLRVSPDGNIIVAGSYAGPLWLWSAYGESQHPDLRGHGKVGTVVFSPDGTRVVSGEYSDRLRVWDAGSAKLLRTIETMKNYNTCFLGFSEDGQYFATRSPSAVRIWDCATTKEVSALNIPGNGVDRLAFSPDGKIVATCVREDQLHFSPSVVTTWLASSSWGQKLVEFRAHENIIRGIDFMRDGRMLVTLSADGFLCVWDGVSGSVLFSRNIGQDTMCTVLSPERNVLACVGFFGSSVRLWDLTVGCELPALSRLQVPVEDVRFDPASHCLVTRSPRGSVQVWDVQEGRCVRTSADGGFQEGAQYVIEEGNLALGETLIKDRRWSQPIGWLPVALHASSDEIRPRWYGHVFSTTSDGEHLYGFSLEGCPSPKPRND